MRAQLRDADAWSERDRERACPTVGGRFSCPDCGTDHSIRFMGEDGRCRACTERE